MRTCEPSGTSAGGAALSWSALVEGLISNVCTGSVGLARVGPRSAMVCIKPREYRGMDGVGAGGTWVITSEGAVRDMITNNAHAAAVAVTAHPPSAHSSQLLRLDVERVGRAGGAPVASNSLASLASGVTLSRDGETVSLKTARSCAVD